MTVDTLGEWLVAQSVGRSIHIAENGQAGTSAWTIQAPNSTSPALLVPAGQARDFTTTNPFVPGEKVMFLTAAVGSMTFTWSETL